MSVFNKIKKGLEEAIVYERFFSDTPANNLSAADALRGRNFELWCAELLRRHDFNVEIAASPGADIIAEKHGMKYAAACKCHSSRLVRTAIEQACVGRDMHGCHVAVLMVNFKLPPDAEDPAKNMHVAVWGRDMLLKMLTDIH